MTTSSDGLGNMARLSGLKNVHGRKKILPGAEYLENLEAFEPDVSGTANPSFQQQTMPEPEMGTELTPQSYDVRANQVITPPMAQTAPEQEQPPQPSFMSRLGENLKSQWNKTPAAFSYMSDMAKKPQVPEEEAEQSMEQPQPEMEQKPSFFSKLGQNLKSSWKSTPAAFSYMPEMNEAEQYGPEEQPLGQRFLQAGNERQRQLEEQANAMKAEREANTPYGPALPTESEKIEQLPHPFPFLKSAFESFIQSGNERQKQLEEKANTMKVEREANTPYGPALPTESEKIEPSDNTRFQAEIDAAQNEPGGKPVFGATDHVMNQPEMINQFSQQTGINLTPEMLDQTKAAEAVMTGQSPQGVRADLIKQLQQNIANNSATDADKFYIGLALLMPLVVGGIFGKEAGLAALAGGTKGYADVLGNRQKQISADQEALANLTEKDEEMALKRETLEGKGKSAFPTRIMINKKTGREEPYSEYRDIFIPEKDLTDPLSKKQIINKEYPEFQKLQEQIDPITDSTREFFEVASQIKDFGFFKKLFNKLATTKDRDAIALLSPEITINGRRVNAGLKIDEIVTTLQMQLAQARKLGQLDSQAQKAANKIISNPYTSFASIQDAISLMMDLREGEHKHLKKFAEKRGWNIDNITNEIDEEDRQVQDLFNIKREREESSSTIGEK